MGNERTGTAPLQNIDREPRRRGPSIRSRFVARAETLKSDPGYERNVRRVRRAWNAIYPEYALGSPGWMPESGAGPEYRLFLLPPALAREHTAAVDAGRPPSEANWKAFTRWRRAVLSLCEWGWPSSYFPNWLNEPNTHPAVVFVSASLIWRPESVPAGAIVTGGPPAQPLLFDPADEMSHPAVAFWYAYAQHFAGSLRAAIETGKTVDIAWHEKTIREAVLVALDAKEAQLDRGVESPFWYVHIYPGITTMDRDEMMASIMEAAAYQYGDRPLYRPVSRLDAKGWSQSRIAAFLGIDRKTVSRLLQLGKGGQS